MSAFARLFLCAFALAASLAGCSSTTDLPDGDAGFRILSVSPTVLIPGTKLLLRGEGFRSDATMSLSFQGQVSDGQGGSARRLDFALVPHLDDLGLVSVDITSDLLTAAGGPGHFEGKLVLSAERDGQRGAVSIGLSMELANELTPVVEKATPSALYFGDTLTLSGGGFLLGGHEGDTQLLLRGTFLPDGGEAQEITDYPVRTVAKGREELAYVHTPEVFGLRTGEFRGTLVARNTHRSGKVIQSAPLRVSLLVLPPVLATLAPSEASREQRVKLAGHGFYQSQSDGSTCVLRLKGTLKTASGSSSVNVDQPLRVDASAQATWVLEPQEIDGQFQGFGSTPGTFTGSIQPVLGSGKDELSGQAWQGTFKVLPTKQVVYLKFTPGFTDALYLFGLRNLEKQVKQRIFDVARRDYGDFNLDFREEKPTDFEQFTTMELTGDDPNEVDLFGLDNTDGKDLGNVRLNDYVGGKNAEQIEQGSFAYGGVFLSSFLRFSPDICRKESPDGIKSFVACPGKSTFPMKSPRFDAIFKPFVPLLGGTEARLEELSGGARQAQVKEAVRVLGNIAGNTVVHELGHSLGLAQETGVDEFHNPGDTPGQIMNPGGARPFEERAELDGQGPAVWAPGDRDYLQQVLPLR